MHVSVLGPSFYSSFLTLMCTLHINRLVSIGVDYIPILLSHEFRPRVFLDTRNYKSESINSILFIQYVSITCLFKKMYAMPALDINDTNRATIVGQLQSGLKQKYIDLQHALLNQQF